MYSRDSSVRRGFEPDSTGIKLAVMLKSAWEIALEKNEVHEDLSRITREYLEHVALLEEGWTAIRGVEREGGDRDSPPLERAA
jgi:hypothetical protein